jgi:uncharacterized membrane protein
MLDTQANEQDNHRKSFAQLNYILYFASGFFLVPGFIAITINYLKLNEVKGTYLESHFRWQINTFWISLIGSVFAMLTPFSYLGLVIFVVTLVVVVYRSIKGLTVLNKGQPLVG